MPKSLKILFFGNERIATGISAEPIVFRSLLESHHKVVGLVVHLSDGSGRVKRSEPIVDEATSKDVPVINPTSLRDVLEDIKAFQADCGVLIAYGKIIPQEIIDIFPHGIINIHPSLLPKYRGSTPIESAILNGEAETGVSIMSLVKAMDAGPIYASACIEVSSNQSKQDIAENLQQVGKKLLLETLDSIANSTQNPVDQIESEATFTTQIHKQDGQLDFSKTADRLFREIRAYAGWPGSWISMANLRVKITGAVVDNDVTFTEALVVGDSSLHIRCGDGAYLNIISVQPEGKKEMPLQAFLNGYRSKF